MSTAAPITFGELATHSLGQQSLRNNAARRRRSWLGHLLEAQYGGWDGDIQYVRQHGVTDMTTRAFHSLPPGTQEGEQGPIIFISHSSKDANLAREVLVLVQTVLRLSDVEIRCTASQSHSIPVGSHPGPTLCADLHVAKVVIGLITNRSLQSSWVMFELGAAWYAGKLIIPLLGHGVSRDDLPGPLRGAHAIGLGDSKGLEVAVSVMAEAIGAQRLRTRRSRSAYVGAAESLVRLEAQAEPDIHRLRSTSTDLSTLENLRQAGSLRIALNPRFESLFGSEIDQFVMQMSDAIVSETIRFNEVEKFRYHFARMLQEFPSARFCATSLPYSRYFWHRTSDNSLNFIEKETKKFVDGGGKFTRLFFIREEDLVDPDVLATLRAHRSIGVEVLIGHIEVIPDALQRYFVYDRQYCVGWQVDITTSQAITNFRFTVNLKKVQMFDNWWRQLVANPGVQPWTPPLGQ